MSPFPALSELYKRRAPGSAPLVSSMFAILYAGLVLAGVMGASHMMTDEAQAMQGPPAAEADGDSALGAGGLKKAN